MVRNTLGILVRGPHRPMAVEVGVLVALSPFVVVAGDGAWIVPVTIVGVWALMHCWTDAAWPRTPLNVPIAALLAVSTVSLVWSEGRAMWAAPKVATLTFGIAWFFALVRWHRVGLPMSWLLRGMVAACLVLTAVGTLIISWLHKVWPISEVTLRLPHYSLGGGLHPNAVAGVLVLLIPLCLPLLMGGEGSVRARFLDRSASGVAFAAALVLLVLTQSRGGWLGALAMAVVWLVYRFPLRPSLSAAPALVAFGLACGVVAFRASIPGTTWVGTDLEDQWVFRQEMWRLSSLLVADFPWTGVGFNGFRHLALELYPSLYSAHNVELVHPHNMWLSAAVDVGLPGLVVYVTLWLTALRGQLAPAAGSRGGPGFVSRCLVTAWVGFWTFGIADAIPLGTKLGTFMWLSLAVAECQRVEHAGQPHATA